MYQILPHSPLAHVVQFFFSDFASSIRKDGDPRNFWRSIVEGSGENHLNPRFVFPDEIFERWVAEVIERWATDQEMLTAWNDPTHPRWQRFLKEEQLADDFIREKGEQFMNPQLMEYMKQVGIRWQDTRWANPDRERMRNDYFLHLQRTQGWCELLIRYLYSTFRNLLDTRWFTWPSFCTQSE